MPEMQGIGVRKYRKKPVVIDAIRYDGSDPSLSVAFLSGSGFFHDIGPEGIKIATTEGIMLARPGDWIIRGVQGEFYPCKNDIFEKTYELVEPNAAI